MSLLYRNGTGRNNIAWGGGNTTKANYLRRTANGRNNISFINVTSNGTHKLMERTASGRNNIRWNNITFNFFNLADYPLQSYTIAGQPYPGHFTLEMTGVIGQDFYNITQYLTNGYNLTRYALDHSGYHKHEKTDIWIHVKRNDKTESDKYFNALKSHYSKLHIKNNVGTHTYAIDWSRSYSTSGGGEVLLQYLSGPEAIDVASINQFTFS